MRAIVLRDGVVLLIVFFQATGRFPCFDLYCWLAMIPPVLAAKMEEAHTLPM